MFWEAVCTAITRASVSVTSVLLVCARVNFVVVVVVCGDDDLLLNEIFVIWEGDISDDAEFIDARLMVISPSVMPIIACGGVAVCVCVDEAAARTGVRRLICRFPTSVSARDSHYSSAVLRSICTGWAVAGFQPRRRVYVVVRAGGVCVCVSDRVFCSPVSIVVGVVFRPVCIPGLQLSVGGLRTSLVFAVVCAFGIRCALVRLSSRLAVFQIIRCSRGVQVVVFV